MRKMLDPADSQIARNGPYFWTYTFAQLQRLGMVDLGLQAAEQLWKPMLDAGATTLWETFLGDDLDSYCHPWSGAPVEFLLTAVAGLPAWACATQRVELRPQYNLVDRMSAKIATSAGMIEIAWQPIADGRYSLRGELPAGVQGVLHDPHGVPVGVMSGAWEYKVAGSTATDRVH
jgi:hypothetical protein